MIKIRNNQFISNQILSLLTFILCTVYLTIFYLQSVSSAGNGYHSDLQLHVKMVANPDSTSIGTGYSLLHTMLSFFSNFFPLTKANPIHLYNLSMIILLLAAMYSTIQIINYFYIKKNPEENHTFIAFLTIALMIVSMIIVNPSSSRLYLGIGSANIYHNPTYIFCKPFALIVFILLITVYEKFKAGLSYSKDLLFLSLFSILSMAAKPSFLMSFLPAVAIIFLYKWIKKEVSLKFVLQVGASLALSILPLISIYLLVYNSDRATSSIVFTFGKVWLYYSDNIAFSILLAMAFPLYVLFLNFKKLSFPYFLALVNYIVAFFVFFFLAEDGHRFYHANFSWTYLYALFFMFFISFQEFFFNKTLLMRQKIIGWVLFLLHLLSGGGYLLKIFLGYSFF